MRMRRTLAYLFFAACVLVGVIKNRAADTQGEERKGSWTIARSDEPGKIEFGLIERHHGGTSSHQSDWSAGLFQGVDFSKPGRQDVHFVISRDARQMKEEHLSDLDSDKLIAFRIFGVDATFIHDLRAEGLKISESDKLVAFRIHGVSPKMVRSLHQAGYSPDEDTLVAMRIHGATPEWMQELKQRGYDHVELEKLIAFRIHGVSPDFIGKLQGLGYTHPEPDQLIAMRIHNVTPEYIAEMKSRGMRDLSIDQLVNMRIHGID